MPAVIAALGSSKQRNIIIIDFWPLFMVCVGNNDNKLLQMRKCERLNS